MPSGIAKATKITMIRITMRSSLSCAPSEFPRGDGERLDHAPAQSLLAFVFQAAVRLECVHRPRHGDLLRDDERAHSDREDLAKVEQAPHRAVISGRRARDGEHSGLEHFEPGLALLLDAAHPVERVLE